ncbi:NAD(P)-dependent oxidoreductase [Alphaproteobacteria bacterium]|jgi:3-hydroxyisobutyrate dehydrogenase|nr:NAD(P)-dependent oxidoreductase [Alphaproteobacteria bacterium]MDA9013926.1 NAD(P)-dependent oxidoreductase [Alphaproteobacteria bacterium]MDG2491074.1 NAD(P)-dependent oxidoreductase [Alphaproteobacteria bacterium]
MTDQQDKTPVNGGAGIIGIVGLGNAGSAIAAAFAALGVVHGYDQNAGRRDDAAGKGIITHDHLDGVASQADVIILSLPHPDISIAVTTQIMAQPIRPKLVIETSTVTPQTAIDCAALASAKDVGFVDAAIAGGVASMANGQMTFFMGGDDAAKAMARPVLESVAAGIYDLGDIGAGMGIKVVNNAVMHALMVVLIEAFAMSKKLGVQSDMLISILNREEGMLRPLVHRVQERMKYADFEGGMSVTNARKDSCLALATAQQMGVPLFAISASHTPYEIAEANGLGDADYAALSRLWEDWANIIFKEADKP